MKVNNKYKNKIDELLENYFLNITKEIPPEDFNVYEDDNDIDLTEALEYGLSKLDEAISEEEFNKLKPGDFILVKQFQSNLDPNNIDHVIRPLLITHIINDRAYGFITTTKVPDVKYLLQYLLVADYKECGLLKECYLDLEVCNFYKRQFIKDKTNDVVVLGHITEDLKNKLLIRMQQIISAESWLDTLSYYPNKIVADIHNM